MSYIDEIKRIVYFMRPGHKVPIKSLPKNHDAWIELDKDGRKIFAFFQIPAKSKKFIDDFSSIHIREGSAIVKQAKIKTLRLECWDYENGKNVFCSICENFVDPNNRKTLISDPGSWSEEWKKQLGNAIKRRSPSDVIAELLVLLELQKNKIRFEWGGPKKGTHDILCEKMEIEVKSSTVRSAKRVHVSSQHQTQTASQLPLYLAFLGFEKSSNGRITIDSVANDLLTNNFSKSILEEGLRLCGYPDGKPERTREKYNRLEDVTQYYEVDESFPKITPESFIGGAIPQGITSIQYTIDLSGNQFRRLTLQQILKSQKSVKSKSSQKS